MSTTILPTPPRCLESQPVTTPGSYRTRPPPHLTTHRVRRPHRLRYTAFWSVRPELRNMQGLITHVRIRYRYSLLILRAMVISDFRLRYQSSLLGYLWTLLKPLAMFTILYIVFVQLLKIGAAVPFNAIYLLFGIVIWSFFAEATTLGLASLVQRSDLLRKISFPRYVIVGRCGHLGAHHLRAEHDRDRAVHGAGTGAADPQPAMAAAALRRAGDALGGARSLLERPLRALPRSQLHLGSRAAGRLLRGPHHLSAEYDPDPVGALPPADPSRRSSRTHATRSSPTRR